MKYKTLAISDPKELIFGYAAKIQWKEKHRFVRIASPPGNVAAACCNLWRNKSAQNVKLLADIAPVVYIEQLRYDVRLFNNPE